MSTLSKETIEAANSTAETAAIPASSLPQASAGQLHADAVSLEVPLKVHGSKVTEVVRGVTPHTEPFEEQTTSMIVFPHGGVLRMSTPVNSGQMLVLTNLKSRQDAICRVIKVRSYSNTASYVEVEFTHRQAGYWGVYFESDGPATASEPNTAPASAADPSAKAPVAPTPMKAGTSAPSSLGARGRQESSFIGIGSQEEVQPPASTTSATARKSSPETNVSGQNPGPYTPVKSAPSAGGGARAQEKERGSLAAVETHTDDSQTSTEARNSAGALATETFGAGLTSGAKEEAVGESKNWMLIAACGAALFLAIGAGILLFHHKSADSVVSPPQAPIAAPAVASQPAVVSNPQPVAAQPSPKTAPMSASVVRETPAAVNPRPAKEQPVAVAPSEQPEQPDPVVSSKKTVPSTFGTLNAHPVSTHEATAGPSAPNVESSAAPPSEQNLLGIASAPNAAALPPPGFKASVPGLVGGRTKEPQLLTRVMPQYPTLARQAHTEGDVGVQILIDKAGNVADAKVVSGPAVLRQSALDAVRRWKYEPSQLDGQPTSVEMLVTIRFRL